MARFNALRDALEEDPFLGGGPMGDAEADPTVIDYGDTTMARASGLRARPPVAADWREKEAERLAREKLDAERLVPSTDMLSRVAERSRDPSMKLIPVANAPSRSDASAAVASTLPATTDKQPAGKPNSDGAPNLPAPSSEGAGGDSERDLYLARLGAQTAAGFGGMGAGKSIDMGIADTLGERLKQVQALRAKREEKEIGDVEERTNLNAAIDSYKRLFQDQADALEEMRGSTNKPAVLREALNAWRQKMEWEKGKFPVAQATVAQKGAVTDLTKAKIPEVALEGESKRALRQAQIDKLRKQSAANALALTKSKAAVAGAKTPAEAARFLRDDIKTAEKAISPTLENFKNIEAAAPGFIFGKVPDWLTQTSLVAAEKSPLLATKAAPLRAALENLIIDIRHGSFGASLTASEKASFETLLNTSLTGSAAQLANVLAQIRRKAASIAQTHFATTQNLYPEESSRVLSSSAVFGPAIREGGIYSDVWTLPKTSGAPAGMVKIKHSSGRTTTVDRATADQMLKDDPTNFAEVK